jgi:hypothetical protein
MKLLEFDAKTHSMALAAEGDKRHGLVLLARFDQLDARMNRSGLD